MVTLVLIESPGKIKKIGSILGSGYVVMASIGSVCDLPHDQLAVDIQQQDINTYTFVPHFTVRSDRKSVVSKMYQAAKQAKLVLLASDPDREGESISEQLNTVLHLKDAQRITFNEITESAVKNAIRNPREIDMNLVRAQRARRVLDRLVGYLISPLLGGKRSAGRVQSVVLKMIIEKDRDVRSHLDNITLSIKVLADFTSNITKARLKTPIPNEISKNGKDVVKWLLDVGGLRYKVLSVEVKEEKRHPPPPFTTSTLQTEAWKKLRKNSEQTMKSAQELYQKGLITYMRTDSTAISGTAREAIGKYIRDAYGEEYHTGRSWDSKKKGSTSQDAHECIRPTDITVTHDEDPLYQLIWHRTVASQMSPALFYVQQITLQSSTIVYEATTRKLVFPGYMILWVEEGEEQCQGEFDSNVKSGDMVNLTYVEAAEHAKPGPVHFNAGTIIKHMEETGIGRPSTYASTLKTLGDREYIKTQDFPGITVDTEVVYHKVSTGQTRSKKKKTKVGEQKKCLIPTDVGVEVYTYMMENFSTIMCTELTANMETSLDQIAHGQADWQSAVNSFFMLFYPKVLSLKGTSRQLTTGSKEYYGEDENGCRYYMFEGKYGPAIKKDHPIGDGTYIPSFSHIKDSPPQTLEEAITVAKDYRLLGMYRKLPIFLVHGEYGLYIRHGAKKRVSIRTQDADKVTFEGAKALLK